MGDTRSLVGVLSGAVERLLVPPRTSKGDLGLIVGDIPRDTYAVASSRRSFEELLLV